MKDPRETIAWWITLLIWLFRKLGQHKTVAALLVWIPVLDFVAWLIWGDVVITVTLVILQLLVQLAIGFGFMILQFVGLFWFMAQTRQDDIRPGDPKSVTFDSYWGQPHLVKMVREWLILLKDRGQFKQMGGRPISGLLLSGPPGTGKTLLAKAMAGDAGVAYIGMEGSGFRAMFWGVDVMKMIAFCKKARARAREFGACIAYIDEIDSVGQSRGGVQGGGQTQIYGGMMGMGGGSGALTRLLYEMDGAELVSEWDKIENGVRKWLFLKPIDQGVVLFMGSTNRPDVLDPALLRPGRFDRHIEVNLPDKSGRREILKGYLGTISHADDVDVDALVADTAWATPAKICLFRGTRVLTEDGWKAIDQIGVGERVWTHQGRLRRVTEVIKHRAPSKRVKIELKVKSDYISGLSITPEHPVLTTRGWVPAGEILTSDEVIVGCFKVCPYCKEVGVFPGNNFCSSRCQRLYSWRCVPEEKRTQRVAAVLRALPRSKQEFYIELLINHICPGRFIATGNGQMDVGGVFPDFVDRENRLIIEYNGSEWRRKSGYWEKRLAHFDSYGYKTLVIDDRDFEFPHETAGKIRRFVETHNHAKHIEQLWFRPMAVRRVIHKDVGDQNKREYVWNLEVDEDQSYIAKGFVVHNCQSITKDSVRLAMFAGREKVTQLDIEMAMMEQAMGLQNPITDLEPAQREQIAIHEAGHAVVQYHLRPDERIVHLTITRRTTALGFMLPVPLTDIYTMPLEVLAADVQVALAGHVATALVLGRPWTGASGDLQAVRFRLLQLAQYGYFGSFELGLEGSAGISAEGRKGVETFLRRALEATMDLLKERRAELDALVKVLLEKNDLSGQEVVEIIKRSEHGQGKVSTDS